MKNILILYISTKKIKIDILSFVKYNICFLIQCICVLGQSILILILIVARIKTIVEL